MKHRILTLLLLVFVFCVSGVAVVSAANKNTTTVTKTVKVNEKVNVRKIVKISKNKINKYSFTSSKRKVATVTKSGIVQTKKTGKTVITVTSKEDGSVYAKVTIKVKNRYTKAELRLLSSLIFCEAGGECYAGQKAVGIVVMNRIKSHSFPNTLSSVIYQPGQFTPARTGFLANALNKYDNGKIPKSCISAAKLTLNGDKTVQLSSGKINMSSYLFFSGYVRGCRLRIGGHQFK